MGHSVNNAQRKSSGQTRPFIATYQEVIHDPALSAVDLRVLQVIAGYDWESNDNGCTASYKTLAKQAAVSESTLKRAIARLAALNYLLPPQPTYRKGACLGNVLKLSGRMREGRGFAAPVTATPQQQPLESSAAPSSDKRRGFSRCPRPDVPRAILEPRDAERIELLEQWGANDPADQLGLLLGLIVQREIEMKRTPTPDRIRAIYDGAVRSKILYRQDIRSRVGLLQTGIERRFLLARPKEVSVTDMPPGAREHLEYQASRVAQQQRVSTQTISDFNIASRDFAEVVEVARERVEEEKQQDVTGVNDSEARDDIAQRLLDVVNPIECISIKKAEFTVDGMTVTITPHKRFDAQILAGNPSAILRGWGYSVTIAQPQSTREATARGTDS